MEIPIKKHSEEIGIILFDDDYNAIGKANYDRWNKLPWYKRLLGYFFYCYKRKYIDIEGFPVRGIDTSYLDWRQGDKLYLDKDNPGGLTNKRPNTSSTL